MNSRTRTQEARNAVLSRLEKSNSERVALINTIGEETDADQGFVADVVDQFETSGEIYVVNGVVKKT